MAAFRVHVTFSSLLGIGYAGALWGLGRDQAHCLLAGGLCGIAGMVPDLDSDSGKPIREIFGITAAAAPLMLFRRIEHAAATPEGMVVLGAGLYLLIRFGLAWLFKRLTVHRGMFHSLPAAVIAAELVFLTDQALPALRRLELAGAMLLGFLSHLVLDEIYSVDLLGLRLNKAAGSAVKLFSGNVAASLFTWLLLGTLTYLVGVDQGYWQPIPVSKHLAHLVARLE